jgi:hypothetical protein
MMNAIRFDDQVSLFDKMSLQIIKQQAAMIGRLAWDTARTVPGINIIDGDTVHINQDDPKTVINSLVARYESLFGPLSREMCREAIAGMTIDIPKDSLPSSLI